MKKLIFILLFDFVSLFASSINIAVASNVNYAIDELKNEFEKRYPKVKVNVILGSSGKLTAQIKHGAPYGVFMSANMEYPEALFQAKLTQEKPLVYAEGTLSLLSVKEQKLSEGLKLLEDKKIKRIAIANPKTAPYGKATLQALQNAGIYKNIESKFIYGESISTTLSYTIKAADIGIVASSSLYAKEMKKYKKGRDWVPVNPNLYTPIKQGIVLLKTSKNADTYKKFYDFILSAKAKEIFKKYGYISL